MTRAVAAHREMLRTKLIRALGDDRAAQLLTEIMRELSMSDVQTADDVLSIAERLRDRGGMLSVVGSALVSHAELHGARATG